MRCAQCQFDNPEGMKFCGQCGSALSPRCPRCGSEVPAGFKFCGECGAPLSGEDATAKPAPPPTEASPTPRSGTPDEEAAPPRSTPVEGERKQVSVVLCELADASRLSERLDSEVLHGLLSSLSELAREEVARYEGTVNRLQGPGFLALFGAPVAHEDHPRRAVLAALGVASRLEECRDEVGVPEDLPLAVRIGIDTGPVVFGGAGDMAVGEATETAAALRDHAAPGAVLVSERTSRFLKGHVGLEPADAVAVAGRDEPLPTFRVTTVEPYADDETAFDPATLSPFVGRQRELDVLGELGEQAEQGQGQVVGIAGEAGSGKSRLLYEFRRTLKGRPVVYLRGHCLSYGSGVPYLPLLHMIRRTSGITASDGPAEVTAKLKSSLEQVGSPPERDLPYLLRLLGIKEGTESLEEIGPQAVHLHTFEAMRRMILNASKRSLVVIELEDLHWIDQTSEEFLSSLVEVMGAARLLILMTYRAGYRPSFLEKSYATQITMRRLSREDSQEVVASALRRAELPEALGSTILDKGEGNPFFLEELARALIEHRERSDGETVPDTIQGLLMSRIDRLPEEHKRLLQTASVLGREFSLELLTELWDGSAELESLLGDLKRWEFLYEAPDEERSHLFKHALTQEVAYQSLLTSRRRTLHRTAAEALERLYADHLEDAYDRLVHHYPRAGETEKTVHYLTRFAEQAAAEYAHAEAARALYEAIEHAEELPEAERDGRVLDIVLKLADSLLPLARFPETLELCEQHRERVERLEDLSLEARYHFWLAHTHSYLGNQDAAAENAQRAITAAREIGDENTEGRAHYVLGRDRFWAGKFADGLEASLQAVVLLERSGDAWWQGQAYWVAGFHHYVLGQFGEALEAMERAHAIGEALDDYRLDTSWSTGYFYASLGEWESGIEKCQAGLEEARDPLNTATAQGFLGYAQLQKGDLDAAIEALEASVERLEAAGMQQLLGWFATYLGEAYLEQGHPEDATRLARRGLEVTRQARFHYGVGLAQRALGRILRLEGELDEAAEHLTEARATFESLEVPFETARTDLELALLGAVDDAEGISAEQHLRAAHACFNELHVPKYVERAEAVAEELGVNVNASS